MKKFWHHAGLASALYIALAAHDLFYADEPFNLAEFLLEDTPEWALIAGAIAFGTYAIGRLRETLAERDGLASALDAATRDGDQWRATARVHAEGLAQAIRRQFGQWRLSAGESDVAMLMLKGLSHKEIARLRQSTAATVRQQAAAVYLKSGLSSRAGLAAFFLEDLFPSSAERDTPSNTSYMPEADSPPQGSPSPI